MKIYKQHNEFSVLMRFFKKVDKTDLCWNWKSYKSKGYGRFRFNDDMVPAHRFIFELYYDSIPNGMFICHRCDNKKCVRPDHLFLGTRDDNAKDYVAKNRKIYRFGSKPKIKRVVNTRCKSILDKKAQIIIDMYKSNLTRFEIQKALNIKSNSYIYSVLRKHFGNSFTFKKRNIS